MPVSEIVFDRAKHAGKIYTLEFIPLSGLTHARGSMPVEFERRELRRLDLRAMDKL